MTRRVVQRIATTGHLRLPAVPGLADEIFQICAEVFAGSGRGFFAGEADPARLLIRVALKEAFSESQRSKVEIAFEAEAARPLGFVAKAVVRSIADAYERWIGTSEGPLFGAHPDARVMALAGEAVEPATHPILDFGAGTGRNALALARRGHPVDAVEITPKFAEILANAAAADGLGVRVVIEDVFRSQANLRRDYGLLFASEVVPDFRGVSDLRHLFELASMVLADGGLLLFNIHLCAQGYNPDKGARELAQQCYSALFTPSEVTQAAAGLPFLLVANDSVHDYEKEHLPAEAWPPTTWYVNWTTGLDVFELAPEDCPVELRWLVFRKGGPNNAADADSTTLAVTPPKATRARRFDPVALRKALAKRLLRRLSAAGTLTLPAVPGMLNTYSALCSALFRALGRDVGSERVAGFRRDLERMLNEAFTQSQRSNVVVSYEAPAGTELKYTITADPVPVTEAYAQWAEAAPEPMFGWHPDARLLALVEPMKPASSCPVLDVGAGLGRNALHLAGLGHPVDAIEITPTFARAIASEALRKALPVRVIERDILTCVGDLRRDYRLVLASGTVGDLRNLSQLRSLFELSAEVLVDGGVLLLGLHVAADGYLADATARQWAQQCCAMFFSRDEITQAMDGLGLFLVSDLGAKDYEQTHLPQDAWPPTSAFTEWALGQHLYALEREQCPIELRWLAFERIRASMTPFGPNSL